MSWQHLAGIAGSLAAFVGALTYLAIEIGNHLDEIGDILSRKGRPRL